MQNMEVEKNGDWMDRPGGLLAAIRAVKWLLATSEAYALTGRQLNRAARLLGVHGERGIWHMGPDSKKRLRLVGIDPETCEVADEVRFSHALDYMRATETFRWNGFLRWLETHDEPSSVPAQAIPQQPHPAGNARREERERALMTSNLLRDRLRNRFFS